MNYKEKNEFIMIFWNVIVFVIAISLLRRASPNGQAHRHDIVLILKEITLLVEATSGWRWHKLVPFLLEHFSLF